MYAKAPSRGAGPLGLPGDRDCWERAAPRCAAVDPRRAALLRRRPMEELESTTEETTVEPLTSAPSSAAALGEPWMMR